jgi:hypothetical protein
VQTIEDNADHSTTDIPGLARGWARRALVCHAAERRDRHIRHRTTLDGRS